MRQTSTTMCADHRGRDSEIRVLTTGANQSATLWGQRKWRGWKIRILTNERALLNGRSFTTYRSGDDNCRY